MGCSVIKKNVLLLLLLCSCNFLTAQNFYDINTLQKIELYFSSSNWDYQLDTSKYGKDNYVVADWVKINNIKYDSVGVKYKGNSSYDSTYKKNPLHIELDYIKNQTHNGYQDIKLGNGYADPSHLREVLSYAILSNYMACPKSNFAQVYINGKYTGLYSNTESINKNFCSNYFNSSSNTFFKCNPTVIPGPTKKSNLKYINNDSTQYYDYYELKSNTGWNEFVSFCDTITNFPNSIANVIDVDRAIWMLAFNSVLVNLDSYSGVFAQNYYLYKDFTNRFNPIIWDLNMCFGGFPYLGSGPSSMGSLTIANMQQLPYNIHATDPYWPLIKNILSDPMQNRMYIAHMKTILTEFISNNNYSSMAGQMQSLIDTAVLSDQNSFFSYTQFQNGLTTNVNIGSYSVPGISVLMNSRNTYLSGTSEFTAVEPVIANYTATPSSPLVNSSVTITAKISNANTNAVYLGYRNFNHEKFSRILMFDDGNHGDGAANDSIYGASFTITSAQAHYYIYAENNNAGKFSPVRAEYEYHTVNAAIQTAGKGDIVINEFLALNQSGQTNEYGQYQDWIEIYNTTSLPKELFGLYMSDDTANKTKFAFPQNTIVQPNSYLIIWADEKNSTPQYLHCNFKLSGAGEQIIISDLSGTIIDSVQFGQQTADQSEGRCPNGSGPFTPIAPPTFNALNCISGINEITYSNAIIVYPNPANQFITVTLANKQTVDEIKIINVLGEVVYEIHAGKAYISEINCTEFKNGLYTLIVNSKYLTKFIKEN